MLKLLQVKGRLDLFLGFVGIDSDRNSALPLVKRVAIGWLYLDFETLVTSNHLGRLANEQDQEARDQSDSGRRRF